jgi:DNA-binding transcriptional LysR family regulator
VALELRTGNPGVLGAAILAGELDAALVAEPIAEAPFDKVVAFVEEPVIVSAAGEPQVGKKGYFPKTIITFEHGCPHRKRLENWYAKHGEMPERIVELGSYHAMLGCVAAGMGIALLPRSVLTTFPESKRLTVQRLPPGENRVETVLIWRKGAYSPNIEALQQILSRPRAGRGLRKPKAK